MSNGGGFSCRCACVCVCVSLVISCVVCWSSIVCWIFCVLRCVLCVVMFSCCVLLCCPYVHCRCCRKWKGYAGNDFLKSAVNVYSHKHGSDYDLLSLPGRLCSSSLDTGVVTYNRYMRGNDAALLRFSDYDKVWSVFFSLVSIANTYVWQWGHARGLVLIMFYSDLLSCISARIWQGKLRYNECHRLVMRNYWKIQKHGNYTQRKNSQTYCNETFVHVFSN